MESTSVADITGGAPAESVTDGKLREDSGTEKKSHEVNGITDRMLNGLSRELQLGGKWQQKEEGDENCCGGWAGG